MKSTITLALGILFSINALGTDRFVDPNLSSGNGTTHFNTISSAVAAAVNGDNIFIVSATYNEPALTLNKSLTLLSQTQGSPVTFNGNIIVAGFGGMNLQLIGFRLNQYSITGNAVSSGSVTNRATVTLINCKMTNMTFAQNFYQVNCLRSQMTGDSQIRFGKFIASKTNNLYITDEALSNQATTSKILVVADTVTNEFNIQHNDYPVYIANCLLSKLYFFYWNTHSSNTNFIRNCQFQSAQIQVNRNAPGYNFEFSSNVFSGTTNFMNNTNSWQTDYGQAYVGPFSTTAAAFPTVSTSGFFNWTYNGINLPCATPSGSDPLVLNRIVGNSTTLNAGNPNNDYYDIDLTVNDRGLMGGPYSLNQFNSAANPSNGRAFIFDIDMPADLFTGQQVNITAEGYQKN
jgi:hypothetical protein